MHTLLRFLFLWVPLSLLVAEPINDAKQLCENIKNTLRPLGPSPAFNDSIDFYLSVYPRTQPITLAYDFLIQRAFNEGLLYEKCADYEPMNSKEREALEAIFIEIYQSLAHYQHLPSLEQLTRHFFNKGALLEAQGPCHILLSNDPNNILGNKILGYIYEKNGNPQRALQAFEVAARQNDPEATYRLGKLLCEGKHRDRGIATLNTLSNPNSPYTFKAKTYLAKVLIKDPTYAQKAQDGLMEAANHGDQEAQEIIGLQFYKLGSFNESIAVLEKAAQSGSHAAIWHLQEIFLNMSHRFPERKQECLRKSLHYIKEGIFHDADADRYFDQLKKIKIIYPGETLPLVTESEIFWLYYQNTYNNAYLQYAIEALKPCRCPQSDYLRGRYHEEQRQAPEAFAAYQQAAQAQHPAACYKMGYIYQKGLLGQKKDLNLAKEAFQQAAQLGDSESYLALACGEISEQQLLNNIKPEGASLLESDGSSDSLLSHSNNTEIPDRNSDTFKNFLKAAQLGNAQAQAKIGSFYYFEQNAKDQAKMDSFCYFEQTTDANQLYKEASEWLEMAAAQKERSALLNLGHFYKEGLGCKKDKMKALEYYAQAACGVESLRGYKRIVALLACQEMGEFLEKDPHEPHPGLSAYYYKRCLKGILPEPSKAGMHMTGSASLPLLLKQAGVKAAIALGRLHYRAKQFDEAKEYYETAKGLVDNDLQLQEEAQSRKELQSFNHNLGTLYHRQFLANPSQALNKEAKEALNEEAKEALNKEMQMAQEAMQMADECYQQAANYSVPLPTSSSPALRKVNSEDALPQKDVLPQSIGKTLSYIHPQGHEDNATASVKTIPLAEQRNKNRSSTNLYHNKIRRFSKGF